jgi:molecular chaperone GrpE
LSVQRKNRNYLKKSVKMTTEQVQSEELNEHINTENASEATPENTEETAIAEETIETVKQYWNDKYTRLAAEFDNYRKRTSKEVSDIIKGAGKDIMLSLLEVLDDYDRAKDQLGKSENVAALKEGIDLIFNKMSNTFKAKGLEEMTSTGQEFDADQHEAIAEIPAPTPELANKVIDTVQKGYLLNGKIIRHAKVVVGKSAE